MKRLKDNILDIRYSKNRHMIPIKSQYISSPVKQCVMYALQGNIDPKIYHKLTPSEKT